MSAIATRVPSNASRVRTQAGSSLGALSRSMIGGADALGLGADGSEGEMRLSVMSAAALPGAL
jgi:hypothetical protein